MKTSLYLLCIFFFILVTVLITSCNTSGQQKDIATFLPIFSTPIQTVWLTPTLALTAPSHIVPPTFASAASPEVTAIKTGEMVQRCPDVVNQLAYSPDSKLLAVTCSDGIYVYDSQTLSRVRQISGGMDIQPLVVDFSPDGEIIASGGNVNLYQVSDGTLLRTLSTQKSPTQSVSFAADGEALAESSGSSLINIWRVSNGAVLSTLDSQIGVTSLAFAPTGSTLAVGGYPHKISLWQTSNRTWLRNFTGHTDEITCITFSPDGKILASGSFDGTAKLWRVKDGTLLHSLEEVNGTWSPVSDVTFSPDGQILATSNHDGAVSLWKVSDGTLIRKFEHLSDNWVTSVAFSSDGKWLAAGTDNGTIRVWSLDQ